MRQRIRLLAFLTLALALYSCDASREDENPILLKITALAEQGDAAAQYNLGVSYTNGDGVPQDYAMASEWFRKAAAQGYAAAQYNLGLLYAKGDGVPQDDAIASEWYRKAAAQGLAEAQYNLGVLYS